MKCLAQSGVAETGVLVIVPLFHSSEATSPLKKQLRNVVAYVNSIKS